MAEKKPEEQVSEQTETAKETAAVPEPAITEQPGTPQSTEQKKTGHSLPRVPLWGWIVGGVVVFFALVGFVSTGYTAMHGLKKDVVTTARGDYALRGDQFGNDRNTAGGTMRGGFGDFGMMGDDNSDTRVSGVVTAVNGDTLTVAGNGTVVTVKVTDDTTYRGASKPAAVNDTITAIGTKSNDVLTATSVRLTR
jgi:hypothetical protein